MEKWLGMKDFAQRNGRAPLSGRLLRDIIGTCLEARPGPRFESFALAYQFWELYFTDESTRLL